MASRATQRACWRGHSLRGWLPRVSLTARLFQRPVEGNPSLASWEGPLQTGAAANPVQMRQSVTSVQALIEDSSSPSPYQSHEGQ